MRGEAEEMIEPAIHDSHPALDAFRVSRAYTLSQAARIAGTTPATIRHWLFGYKTPGHRMLPVFGNVRTLDDDDPLLVSFLDLVEIAVVAKFRAATSGRVSLEKLRSAHEFARAAFGLPYPFATMNIFEFGGHVLHEYEEREHGQGVLALDTGGQWALPEIVREEGTHLDFEAGDPFAVRWFPKGRLVPIVVDPRIAAGRPTIYQSGITIDTITRRWRAGEPIASIAEDYELGPQIVEEVLQYAA